MCSCVASLCLNVCLNAIAMLLCICIGFRLLDCFLTYHGAELGGCRRQRQGNYSLCWGLGTVGCCKHDPVMFTQEVRFCTQQRSPTQQRFRIPGRRCQNFIIDGEIPFFRGKGVGLRTHTRIWLSSSMIRRHIFLPNLSAVQACHDHGQWRESLIGSAVFAFRGAGWAARNVVAI